MAIESAFTAKRFQSEFRFFGHFAVLHGDQEARQSILQMFFFDIKSILWLYMRKRHDQVLIQTWTFCVKIPLVVLWILTGFIYVISISRRYHRNARKIRYEIGVLYMSITSKFIK